MRAATLLNIFFYIVSFRLIFIWEIFLTAAQRVSILSWYKIWAKECSRSIGGSWDLALVWCFNLQLHSYYLHECVSIYYVFYHNIRAYPGFVYLSYNFRDVVTFLLRCISPLPALPQYLILQKEMIIPVGWDSVFCYLLWNMQGSAGINELINWPSISWLGLAYKIIFPLVKREHDFEGEVKRQVSFENDSRPFYFKWHNCVLVSLG